MSEPSFALRDVALLVRCPECHANSQNACLNEWASAPVPTHPERLVAAEVAVLAAVERVPDEEDA